MRKRACQIQMKHIVYGTLRPATRTVITRYRFKRTFRENFLFLRVKHIKNDKRRQQQHAYGSANRYFCFSCQSKN